MLRSLLARFRAGSSPKEGALPARAAGGGQALCAERVAAARFAWQAGKADEAICLLEALIEQHYDAADAHLLLGTILQSRREYDDARDSFALAQCFAPNPGPVYYQLGLMEFELARYAEAAAALDKSAASGLQDARVHNALGAALLHLHRPDDAVRALRRALELQPDFAQAHSNLAHVLVRECEAWDEGAQHIEFALRLAPDDRAALANWAVVLDNRGDWSAALEVCDRLLARHPDFHEARLHRALLLLRLGDFAKGWPDYEARRSVGREDCRASPVSCPEWDGSDLRGKTILVQTEQGLGDEIMFASCVPDVIEQARSCVVACSPALLKLMARSFPHTNVVSTDTPEALVARAAPDWKILVGSLPRYLRNASGDFPRHAGYLRADPAGVARWKSRLAALPGRLKVGISWRGGTPATRRGQRSIPLEQWEPLLHVPGIDFVSLQYSDVANELDAVRGLLGVHVHHWQEAIDDYDETAALVSALDLIVSVQTAVAHVGGALGKPVYTLLPTTPEWRYGATGAEMLWYPSVRLFRQAAPGDWRPVLSRLGDELCTRLTASAFGQAG
ncbi:MAG: tetratricopeptide repeat protein [Burkholderiales bacterium]